MLSSSDLPGMTVQLHPVHVPGSDLLLLLHDSTTLTEVRSS